MDPHHTEHINVIEQDSQIQSDSFFYVEIGVEIFGAILLHLLVPINTSNSYFRQLSGNQNL